MGSEPWFRAINVCIIIDAMLNFDGDIDVDVAQMCEQSIMLHVNGAIEYTLTAHSHCAKS